jgi:regulator of sigma E protease
MISTIIIFLIVLSILVFVHELGHFYTARKFGVKCDEFGFGFPPRLCGWKKVNGKRKFFWGSEDIEKIKSEDTVFSINYIPLGGFVKIKGEDGENKAEPDSFVAQKIWKRVVILSAGVTMNVFLTIFCLIIALMIGAPQVVDTDDPSLQPEDAKVQIISILENSPAKQLALEAGDTIVSLDGNTVKKLVDVSGYLETKENQTVKMTIDRGGELKEYEFAPAQLKETGKPGLGVGLAVTGTVKYPWYKAMYLGFVAAYQMFLQIIVAFYTVIKNALVGQPLGVDLAGPVGIAVMTGKAAKLGFVYVLQFMAMLSMNLAIINFLPFPALDGGRVIFLLVEKIRGKAVSQKIESIVHTVGFAMLMLLFVLVTGKDLFRFREFFINIWHKVIG